MKKIILYIILVQSYSVFGQLSSRNGSDLPPYDTIRAFVVFAELTNDPHDLGALPNWSIHSMPSNAAEYFDPEFINEAAISGYLTKYFYEVSFKKLFPLGDYYPNLVQIDYNTIGTNSDGKGEIFSYLNSLSGSDITSQNGFSINGTDFDQWTRTSDGLTKTKTNDGRLDLVVLIWRTNSIISSDRNGGHGASWNEAYSIKIKLVPIRIPVSALVIY